MTTYRVRGTAKGAWSAGIVERVNRLWYAKGQSCSQQRYYIKSRKDGGAHVHEVLW